jgi:hypothetical protein
MLFHQTASVGDCQLKAKDVSPVDVPQQVEYIQTPSNPSVDCLFPRISTDFEKPAREITLIPRLCIPSFIGYNL